AGFGLLRFLATDGKVDAQPLYLSGLTVQGATHNVVFVATENDSVYAFDADSGSTLWRVSLLGSGETPSGPHGCDQVVPVIGITSTPVIDRAAGAHGALYASRTSHCDSAPYTGWIIAYSQTSLAQTAVLNVAPNATGSGFASAGPAIWMSGGGPAADTSGNVYLLTGNGAFETALDGNGFPSGGDYGNSF